MSAVRTFLSILVATVGLTGCYDLSDPSGPRPEDFVRERSPTQTQEQGQTQEQVECASPCARSEMTTLLFDALEHDDDDVDATARRKLRIVRDDAD